MKKVSKKTLIIIIATCVILSGSASAWYVVARPDTPKQTTSQDSTSTQTTEDTPEVPGPTDQEKKDAEAHKDDVVKQQEAENKPTTGQKAVTPIITTVSQNGQEVFASSYVPGVFEDGGTCTFTFVKDSHKLVKTTSAFGNVSTTNCTNVTVPRGEFAEAGSWTLTVGYTSPKAAGTSQPKAFAVQ